MLPLFSATLFLSAFLLFLIQPMFAKMLLPRLGGTPAVWNTCVVFFQSALFIGYVYAHASIRWLGVRQQALIHVGLLLIPLAFLPIALPATWIPPASANPAGWLFFLLVALVGFPFVAVATNAPLLQRWFAEVPHPSSHDPFFLYAASNLGSLGALLAYPFLIEPFLSLHTQSLVWAGGYVGLLASVGLCALAVRRSPSGHGLQATGYGLQATDDGRTSHDAPRTAHDLRTANGAPRTAHDLTVGVRLRWLALAAVPASLMLSVTTFISVDIAAMPLMWIVPLALYLLSFVIVFARRPIISHTFASTALPVAVVIPLVGTVMGYVPQLWMIPVHLVAFFLAALVCHGELVRTRPSAEHLTAFYLWMSAGGAIGGLLTTLVAPLVFKTTLEYPIGIVAACMLRPAPVLQDRWKSIEERLGMAGRVIVLASPVLLAVFVAGLARLAATKPTDSELLAAGRIYALPLAFCILLWRRPVIFSLALVGILAGSSLSNQTAASDLLRARTFFGTHRVYDRGQYRYLVNGTTNHGMQAHDPARQCEPISYYWRTGPIGQLFASFVGPYSKYDVGLMGLGSGALVTYSQPWQHWTIYEINPVMLEIAESGRYFTHLSKCIKRYNIVLGDARTSVAAAPDKQHDVIVFDAFSSDAIPVHLVTREAFELYLRKLAPGGVMAFHISNRYLDLEPVLDGIVRDLHLAGFIQSDRGTSQEERMQGKLPTTWVIIARSASDFGDLTKDHRWRPLQGSDESPVWTDDYSNLLGILKLW